MDLKEVLGQNIKRYRLLKGYSQEDFSEEINIAQQTLSKIERGLTFVTSKTLTKISETLDIEIYKLFLTDKQNYTDDDVYIEIQKHLEYLKSNPKKLSFILKIIKEISFL